MIRGNNEVFTSLHVVSRLVQGICYREGFTFDRSVSTFGGICEPAPHQTELPARFTADGGFCCTLAILLHEEKTYAIVGPICYEARFP